MIIISLITVANRRCHVEEQIATLVLPLKMALVAMMCVQLLSHIGHRQFFL